MDGSVDPVYQDRPCATVAIDAARRFTGKAVIEHKDCKPDEEAFMRGSG